jgi:outer membrane cobalamin receptor
VQGQAYTHYLARRSRHFSDYTLQTEGLFEDLYATRTGGAAVAAHPFGRRGRWIASVSGSHEQARVTDQDDAVTRGDATVLEAAGGLKYETTRWQLDGAAGVAVPIGLGATPWPETKLVAKYQARRDLQLVATGARKGRVPSLRERYDLETGNRDLGPEKAWHAELRAIEQLGERLRVEVAPYYRRVTGTIRLIADPNAPDGSDALISGNLGRESILGVDAQARVKPHHLLEVGGSYNYIRARSDAADPVLAMAPLDRLPSHRADGWVQVTPDRRIAVLARLKYFGDSLDKGTTVPGYATLEATVTAPLTKQYLGVLRVDDVTDVRPETRKNYHTPGRVISLIVQGTWE